MIRGIHYFSTELKTKIDGILKSCFNDGKILGLCRQHLAARLLIGYMDHISTLKIQKAELPLGFARFCDNRHTLVAGDRDIKSNVLP